MAEQNSDASKDEDVTVTPAPYRGFMGRLEQDEKDLEELEKAREAEMNPQPQEEDSEDNGEEPQDPEEKSFKKRYGDLRRHFDKTVGDLKQEIDDLKKAKKKAEQQGDSPMPKTKEEVQAWMKEFPDVAGILKSIISEEIDAGTEEYRTKLKKIEEREAQVERERQLNDLRKRHEDFDEINASDKFWGWLEDQPDDIQNTVYNSSSAKSLSRVLDLFKSDTGWGKKSKSDSRKAAAESVTDKSSRTSEPADSQNVIRESDVAKMKIEEYEAREDEIRKAISEGRFVYDISGAAR